ncbi:ABC transporter [Propionibacterium freudenreichii]|nr:ABC transporter [Propionibacterium freudenreichii]
MRLARRVAAVLLASVLALTVASCAGAARSAPSLDPNKKVRVTVWAWDSTIERAAQRFNKANPNVSVTVTDAGTTTDQYQALNRALQTGQGVPDAAQIEYYALPEFASRDAVKDLSDYGAKGYKDFLHARHLEFGQPWTTRSMPCPWTPARWRCSTTRRSLTPPESTGPLPLGRSTTRPPGRSARSASTSPPMPATPGSSIPWCGRPVASPSRRIARRSPSTSLTMPEPNGGPPTGNA